MCVFFFVCVCVCLCECVCMSVSVSESVRVFVDFCVGGEEGLLVYAHIPYRAIHDGLRSLPGRGRVWKKTDIYCQGAAGKTLWRYWGNNAFWKALCVTGTCFQRYCVVRNFVVIYVLRSFSERCCVMEIHSASSKMLLCYGQFWERYYGIGAHNV